MGLEQRCSQCGARLAGDVPAELCLRCLLNLGLKHEAIEPELEPDIPLVAPDLEEPFDRYRLIEKIGEGGCGIVYRAEQLAPVRREVALKVIKLGMDTRAVIARFEGERQALALMDHPHIARVFDAGASRNGRPFFVMELVRGEPITEYCDRIELSLRQRLELFVQVCHALEHAHQKGVIHRDLKPSNILVLELDGRPVPKVIDFGVAKATQSQRLAGESLYTAFDQFVGTPAYMSPEQATLIGEDIDTRSDIYSLGVLLYELLVGCPPFDPERLRRAPLDEVCRILREEEPPLPSARAASLPPDQLAAIARHRALPAAKFAAQLRGDLDWLVLKAIEKERDRRYASAGSLAADVERHLAHEPILARPPSALYRFRKFARRNRAAVTGSAAVALALIGGLTVSTRLFVREKEARHWAEARAYASDMGLAARLAERSAGLGSLTRMLSAWPQRKPDQRGWEWYYLNGLCHPEERVIQADSNALFSVAWSPDGTRLATGSAGGQVRLWDAATGGLLATLTGHTDIVRLVTWNPDGQRLASCGPDGTARIWEAGRAAELATLRVPGASAISLCWSPDGRTLAVGFSDKQVKLWEAATGTELKSLRGKASAYALSWSHDGSKLAGAGSGQTRLLWDIATGKELLGLKPQKDSPSFWAIAWSPDDRTLATGGGDFQVKLFDATTGAHLATLWGHDNWICSVTWNADGSRLASADNGDGSVKIWDVAGSRMIRSFRGHQGPAKSVAWHPTRPLVASAGADGTIRIWDADRPNRSFQTLQETAQIRTLSWHPDGRRLASGGIHDSALIWDTRHPVAPIELHSGGKWIWWIGWNPTGTHLARLSDEAGLCLWDPFTGQDTVRLQPKPTGISAAAWSPDGTRLAYLASNCGLNLWDGQGTNATLLRPPEKTTGYALAWSPDGAQLAVASGTRILLVQPPSGQPRQVLSGHSDVVRALAWSPDSTRLISGSDDSLAKIWDAHTGGEILTLANHTAPVYSVAWSPDGTRVLSGSWDGTVKLWNPATGIEVCSFEDHPAQVSVVAFSPDGTRVTSADLDGNIFIRDAAPGIEIEARQSATPSRLAVATVSPSPTDSATAQAESLARQLWRRDVLRRRAEQGDLGSMGWLTWLLATSPHAEVRDGRHAVEFGEKSAALTQRNNWLILNNLAAAHAEAGDFPQAIAVQKEAIALLPSPKAKAEATARLRLYESNQPYRHYPR